jgi:hypothetical protein
MVHVCRKGEYGVVICGPIGRDEIAHLILFDPDASFFTKVNYELTNQLFPVRRSGFAEQCFR